MFDWLYLLQAAFLGIVEGLTEFLPVSSTGHLIVAADLVGFTDATSDTFVVAIQAGAILAVCWYYRMRIIRVLRGLFSEPVQQRLVVNTLVAFLPAAVVGVLVSDLLKTYLFNPLTVATALVIGGLIFGLSRKAATEFSFFLAIPTIFGATVWDLWQAREQLVAANLPGLAVGTVVSFFSALVVVHWLIRFVSRHDFRGFGWYRIIFGGVILLTWATGLVSW